MRKNKVLSRMIFVTALLILFLGLFFMNGCSDPDVVLYCALDRNFSEPLIKEFEEKTGLVVDANYDLEASKSVGLFERIKREMPNPRCDVFWNNELMLTIRLKQLEALQAYKSPNAEDIPEGFRDPDGYWTGFAARARVFIVNRDLLKDRTPPSSYKDLFDPAWKGECGMARPLTGTTATHGTILFQHLEEKGVRDFFSRVLANEAIFTPGNAHVMRNVREGKYTFGFTDTDDYNVAATDMENGKKRWPVDVIYPDQGEGELGTLVIPNSVSMIKGAPHPEAARKLIDFILSRYVEEKLAHATSAQIPLRADVKRPAHVKVPGKDFRAMDVNFEKAAKEFETRKEYFAETFLK